jgi:hypothetical protein
MFIRNNQSLFIDVDRASYNFLMGQECTALLLLVNLVRVGPARVANVSCLMGVFPSWDVVVELGSMQSSFLFGLLLCSVPLPLGEPPCSRCSISANEHPGRRRHNNIFDKSAFKTFHLLHIIFRSRPLSSSFNSATFEVNVNRVLHIVFSNTDWPEDLTLVNSRNTLSILP